jgi:hypothetical protein
LLFFIFLTPPKEAAEVARLEELIGAAHRLDAAKAALRGVLEAAVDKLVALPDAEAFRQPVKASVAPDYGSVVSTPIDLSVIRTVGGEGNGEA